MFVREKNWCEMQFYNFWLEWLVYLRMFETLPVYAFVECLWSYISRFTIRHAKSFLGILYKQLKKQKKMLSTRKARQILFSVTAWNLWNIILFYEIECIVIFLHQAKHLLCFCWKPVWEFRGVIHYGMK